jgi:hypothetical protein
VPLTQRDRRTLTIGGVVAGVLIVGVLLMNVLGGGGGEELALPPFPPPGGGGISPSPTPTSTSTISPVAVFAGRDPFSIPGAFGAAGSSTTSSGGTSSGGSSTTSTSTSTSTGTSSSTSTSTAPGGGTSTSSPPTQPGNGSSTNVGGHTVVLLGVFPRNGVEHAQVEIDGTVYTPAVGQTFGPARSFRLQSTSGNCATFVFGSEPFTLCLTPQK